MAKILEFEREMFLNVLNENSLTIASKGVAINRLLLSLTKVHAEPTQLVFVIGTTADDEDYIMGDCALDDSVRHKPKRVTGESVHTSERRALYMSGGVVFVTSRILVVDMLTDRVPFELISGIVVFNAHNIVNDCQQTFILRLYRSRNKTGFVSGLSQTPNAFLGSFGKLDRIMRSLFSNKLFLWPRFHASINGSLADRSSPNVIEIRVSMTPLMSRIQFCLMDLIALCLKELKGAANACLYECDELTIESVIAGNFNRLVRTHFDPIWYQLSAKSRRMVNDIKLLKSLLFHLTQFDGVSFYAEIKSIRQNVVLNADTSDWLFWEPSDTLFTASKERLFVERDGQQVLDIELNPKWSAFDEVIAEIDADTRYMDQVIDIIVIVEDGYTANKLQQFRDKKADTVLRELYEKCEQLLDIPVTDKDKARKRKTDGKRDEPRDESTFTLTQMLKDYQEVAKEYVPEEHGHRLELHYHTWHDRSIHLEKLLTVLRPKYIVFYEPDMQSIRQIEIYQALYCSPERVKVYFFMYDGSAEEQRYLKSLHAEKSAFEALIGQKASMVVPADRDGKSDSHPDLIRGSQEDDEMQIVSTRKGGAQAAAKETPAVTPRVVIDVREFRSDLPSMIHKRGIDIEPITLEIGDYVLTPDTCVERKSVSDLIGSLGNGRLYHQTQIMTRYYKRSLLLIEFDDQKSFNFKGRYWGSGANFSTSTAARPNVMSQLVILTIQFPALRLVWSPSPHFSAEMFEHLKRDKEEPDPKQVLALSAAQLPAEYAGDKYDIGAKEFLLCLPGVNVRNVYAIMNRVKCVAELVPMSVEELTELLGSERDSELLYAALHSQFDVAAIEGNEKLENEKKKRRFVKRNKK